VNLYPFIEAEKMQQRNVKRACELLEVSRAAYYANRADSPSTRQLVDQELTEHIRQAHQRSKGRYGAPRIHAQLRRDGHRHGRKRIARLLRAAGLHGRTPRRLERTTMPTRLPRLVRIWCAGTSPWTPRRSTPAGAGTSPTSRPGRAGCTWPP
jgi:transposase InsO family protein